MSRTLYQIHISLTLKSPWLVQGSDAGRFGLDATMLLDAHNRPVIPGTLLAGRIAEIWNTYGTDLGNADPNEWLGREGLTLPSAPGKRARLIVTDLHLTDIDGNGFSQHETEPGHEITRIKQDPITESVQKGMLQVIEQNSAANSQHTFEGNWHVWADGEEIKDLEKQLYAALMIQTQLGAYRGIGFGRMEALTIKANAATSGANQSLSVDHEASAPIRLSLTTKDELLISGKSSRGNVFVSGTTIPGGAILGAMATMLNQKYGTDKLEDIENVSLAEHFSSLRCTHALPSQSNGGRPCSLPQSLVSSGKEIIQDVFKHSTPPETQDKLDFQTDWKEQAWNEAGEKQKQGQLNHSIRVRTDIDESGQAKETTLFAYETVHSPVDEQGNPKTRWLFDLDLSGLPEDDKLRKSICDELESLLNHGLFPVGKTDACLQVSNTEADAEDIWPANPPSNLETGSLVPVLLVSDALLFTTPEIADQQNPNLKQLYSQAFNLDDSESGLSLSHFFATQKLAGGEYLQRRYQQKNNYQPWTLTEAGSVFVFKVIDTNKARKTLNNWQSTGLALPENVRNTHGSGWQDHPWRPENGYGEIRVAPQHTFALYHDAQPQTAGEPA